MLELEGSASQSEEQLLAVVEDRLFRDLHVNSDAFMAKAESRYAEIFPKLMELIARTQNLPSLRLHDTFVTPFAPLPKACGRGAICRPTPPKPLIDETNPDAKYIEKLAHLLILHWSVFGLIVYEQDYDDEDPPEDPHDYWKKPRPGRITPFIPVNKAIYAPGKKWLPVGMTMVDVPNPQYTAMLPVAQNRSGRSNSSSGSAIDPGDDDDT